MANWWLTSDGTDQWVFESLTDEEIWGLLKDYEVARRDICLIDHPTALAYAAQLPDLIIKDKEYQSGMPTLEMNTRMPPPTWLN